MPKLRFVAVVALLATIPFLGTLRYEFAYDDELQLSNPLIREHRFGALWIRPFHVGAEIRSETGAWRPLTTATFAANHAVAGARPPLWHATNVLLHAAAAVALLFAATALRFPAAPSFVAAALFAVHPVHAEVVANVTNRTESLHALLFLLALGAYARSRAAGRGALDALPFLAGALLAKETAVAFLPVVAALEWTVPRPPASWRRLGTVTATIAAYLVARWLVLGSIASSASAGITRFENPVAAAHGIDRLGAALSLLATGGKLLVWPRPLVPDYGHAHTVPGVSAASVAGLLLLAAALVALALAVRRRSASLVPLAILVAPWLLVSNLIVPIGTAFGERLLYLPSAGFLLLVAGFVRMRAAVAALLIAGTVASASSASAWRDDFTLFSRAERASPDSVRVLVNLGGELALRGDFDGAERRLRRAVTLAPDLAPARINLAGVLLSRGDREGAAREAARALELDPASPIARRLLDLATRTEP